MRPRVAASLLVVIACSACGGTKKDARVPNLAGVSEPNALERLGAARLCVGKVSWEWDAGPSDEVMKQSPKAGTAMVPYGRVSLTLSPQQGPNGVIYSDWLDGCSVVPSG